MFVLAPFADSVRTAMKLFRLQQQPEILTRWHPISRRRRHETRPGMVDIVNAANEEGRRVLIANPVDSVV